MSYLNKPTEPTHVHYGGGKYAVLDTILNSTNAVNGDRMILYYSMTKDCVYVRTEAEFNELVVWPDNVVRPRFTKVEEYNAP